MLAACASAAITANAAQWSIDTGVASQLTWTSNTALGFSTGRDTEDTVLEVRPRFAIRARGERARVSGTAALVGSSYLNGTLASRVLPQADLVGELDVIERWLFLEGGVRAFQSSENPFGATTEVASLNTVTTTQVSLSPYIESSPAPGWRYRLRSDNVKTGAQGSAFSISAVNASGYFGRHTLAIEREPRPFGVKLEGERSETRYDDSDQRLIVDLARLSADYAFGEGFSAGLRGGWERNSFSTLEDEGSFHGAQFLWRPTERTSLSGFQEERFFGKAWRLGFEHRTPQVAWNLLLQRGIDTTPQSLFQLPASDNVAGLLDAIFTTRYPDPIERSRVVQDFIAQRGLPASTLGPTQIYAQRLSLSVVRNASITLIGSRNTFTLSGYHTRIEDLPDVTSPLPTAVVNNNVRSGAAFTFTRRLTPVAALVSSIDWYRVRALESVSNEQSRERGFRSQLNLQAAARTTFVLGATYRSFESNIVGMDNATAVFVGVDHRF